VAGLRGVPSGLTALESRQEGHVTPFAVRAALKSGRGVISRRAARDKLLTVAFYGFGLASTLLSPIRYPAIRPRPADGPPTLVGMNSAEPF
jgi:hypothetical protein